MKKIMVIFLGVILVIIIVVLLLVFIFAYRRIEVRNISKTLNNRYLETNGIKSKFLSFPRNLDNIDKINDYYYIDFQLRDGSILVLDATYDSIAFDYEINRLNSLIVKNWLYDEKNDYTEYKKLLYSDDFVLFKYPTYVAEYISGKYEYVCIDYENKRIMYVFIDNLSYDKIPLEEKFIPINYNLNIYGSDNNDGYRYTIYPLYQDVRFDEWYK